MEIAGKTVDGNGGEVEMRKFYPRIKKAFTSALEEAKIRSLVAKINLGHDIHSAEKNFQFLRSLPKERTLKYFIRFSKDKNPLIQKLSIAALVDNGNKQARDRIIEMIDERFIPSNVKKEAVYALGYLGHPDAIAPLVKQNYFDTIYYPNSIALSNIREKIIRSKLNFIPRNPEELALSHIDPGEHPKAFQDFYLEAKRRPKRTDTHWKLLAKQLTAVEQKLK